MESSLNAMSLNLLIEYIECHTHRIKDLGLLTPLAQRWLDEIALPLSPGKSTASLKREKVHECARDDPKAFNPDLGDDQSTTNSSHSHSAMSPGITKTSTIIEGTHPPLLSSEYSAELVPNSNETHWESRLHTCQMHSPERATSQASRPEFRPHVQTPSASQSVYQKLMNPLRKRDFETGWVYIFDRSSSPGFVKIGWTARTVSDRLEGWSEHGFQPNLLFSSRSSYAQRVETLTHHELIKEWRVERRCKNLQCPISHREWFEIDKKKAEQVLADWIYFVNEAKPYDSTGNLEAHWVREMAIIKKKTGGIITANELVKHYKSTLKNTSGEAKGHLDLSQPKNTKTSLIAHKKEPVTIYLSEKELASSPRSVASIKEEVLCKHPTGGSLPVRLKPPCKIESSNGDFLAMTIKELAPEEIPLPLSPILDPASF
ncbi:unnamed protein product [Penicillium bialowiezense]